MLLLTEKNDFLYIQLFKRFKENIDNEIWIDDSQIPPEYELMKEYNVSRYTIRKALERLVEEGYIHRQAGKGTFVNSNKSRYKLTSLESFSEQMIDRGLTPSSQVLSIVLEKPSDRINDYLEIFDSENVYKIERLRLADNEPMCYETVYISETLCPGIDALVDNDVSLYKLYEEHYNLKLDYGNIYLEADICSKKHSQHLKIEPGSPLLKMKCVVYINTKKPLYFVESLYIGDNYVFFANMPRI